MRFPPLTGKQMLKALGRAGFVVDRVRGSHHFLRHADGRCTTVPVHVGEQIGPGLTRKILADCRMTREELARYL